MLRAYAMLILPYDDLRFLLAAPLLSPAESVRYATPLMPLFAPADGNAAIFAAHYAAGCCHALPLSMR